MFNFLPLALSLTFCSVPSLSVSPPPREISSQESLPEKLNLQEEEKQLRRVDDLPDNEWYEVGDYIVHEDRKINESEDEYNELYDTLFQALSDYFTGLLSTYAVDATPSDAVFESDIIPYDGTFDISPTEDPGSRAVYDTSAVTNVLAYRVRVNGTLYSLYLSPDDIDRIYIDSSNRMWNVGTTAISGRLFSGNFSPTAATGMIMTLGPCLGNNFSSNKTYGSPNYYRDYYWYTNSSGNQSLTYRTTYCTIIVESNPYPLV
ncbi:hypothetical protein, partial [Glycocaulis alkaliphilus]|uniref:hypothetical protein n=1 Tax=Glycocaulis alkaliphilus TaxID=1434191 RepID=UPI00166A1B5F